MYACLIIECQKTRGFSFPDPKIVSICDMFCLIKELLSPIIIFAISFGLNLSFDTEIHFNSFRI